MPGINSCLTAISCIHFFLYAQSTAISSGKQICVVYLPINWGGFGALRLVFWQLSCSLSCTQLTKRQDCFWSCCCYWIRCPYLRRGLLGKLILATPAAAAVLPPPSLFFPTLHFLGAGWKHLSASLLNLSEKSSLVLYTALLLNHKVCALVSSKLLKQWNNGRILIHHLVELGHHLTLRQVNQYYGNKHRDIAGSGGGQVHKLQGKKRSPK